MKQHIFLFFLILFSLTSTTYAASIDKSRFSARIAALPAAATPEPCNLDFDGNGTEDALTDGILFMRYLSGYTDNALVEGALGTGATRTTGAEVKAFLDQADCTGMKDLDGNGSVDAQTDGLLLMRYLFGFAGQGLVQGALAVDARRKNSNDIQDHLAFYQNPRYALIQGTVAEGDRLSDTWEDIIIEGLGPGSSMVRLVEGKNYTGDVTFSFDATGGEVRLLLPDAVLLAQQDAALAGSIGNIHSLAVASSNYPLTSYKWLSGKDYFSGVGENLGQNRLPIGGRREFSPWEQLVWAISSKDTFELMSPCAEENVNCYQNAKDPVLLVHGYLLGEKPGGGEGTWGDFPNLLLQEGYVPFEFRWNTSARFHDVAVELGGAIKKITDKTGKKVHIIAHSFGGVLTRTLLQQLATTGNEDYGQYVASVTTLGSPHSGILDSNACAFERALPNGQDSIAFEGCGQISCQQAGEPILTASESRFFGVYSEAGSIPVSLARSIENLPDVDIQALIGFTTKETIIPGFSSIYRSLNNGDGLISGWGQRFNPGNAVYGNCETGNISSKWDALLHEELFGEARVTEHILGFGDAVTPGAQNPDENERGYRHTSTSLPAHSVREAHIECTGSATCTHDGYRKSLAWIKSHPSSPVLKDNHTTLTLRTLTGDGYNNPVSGVQVFVFANAQPVSNKLVSGYTGADGKISLQVPFRPSNTYGVVVIPQSPYRGTKETFKSAVNFKDSTTKDLGDIALVDRNNPSPLLNDGQVSDETGAPLGGVSITVRRTDHNVIDQSFQNQSNGRFGFSVLAGRYEITFNKPGYKSVTKKINVPVSGLAITMHPGANLAGGLVAHYAFEGSAQDSSGNQHHGRAENGVDFADGAVGRAASFDGINDYIHIPHDAAFNVQPNGSLTVALWVNRAQTSANDEQHVLSKGHDCANSYFIREGGQEIGAANGSGWCDGDKINVAFPENEWHHVVAIIDNATSKISYYLDGVLQSEQPMSAYTTTNTYPLIIGRHFLNEDGSGGYEYPFKGMVDDLYIYNKVLSPEEIQALYQLYEPPLPPGAGTISLNDTGITWGGDYPDGNNSTCTSNIGAPQDCDQGRDATHNDDSDGHAGFSYTKLDANGNPLPASATTWSCVKDNVTGLIWEVKTDDGGIHDKDNAYRWGGKTAQGSGYGTYYTSWNSLVDGSNTEQLCGFSDWRVPSITELVNLVSNDRVNPAIDTDYFPNTRASHFWSSSPDAADSSSAWDVYFGNGGAYRSNRSFNLQVRLVRSGQ